MEHQGAVSETVIACFAVLAAASFVIYCWQAIGPTDPLFGLLVPVFLLGAAGFAGPVAQRLVPQRWMAVSTQTIRFMQFLGTDRFGEILATLGWKVRAKLVSRVQVDELIRQVHRSFAAHVLTGLVQLIQGVIVFWYGGIGSAALLVLLAIPLHVYPAFLQLRVYRRFVRLRARIADNPNGL